MATEAQVKANQTNAQRSTGPRTEEGKQRAAANSQKHGLCSQKLIVAPHERDDFAHLESELRRDLRPSGPFEEAIFQNLIHAHWDQLRLRQHFANFYATKPDLVADAKAIKTYERLRRYASAADRAFNKAMADLKALQVARCRCVLSNDPLDYGMPTLAQTVLLKNTKRTQSAPFEPAYFAPEPEENDEELDQTAS